jgi:ubiquinone/menaquinone biosynthesis C-methylase UbiE
MVTETNPSVPNIVQHVPAGQICCDPNWEAAYERFETPQQEIDKFVRRLRRFGFDRLPKDSRIAEIFCGRGNGLVALEQMGFSSLEGVDLSDTLLRKYRGPATLHLADCLNLPLQSECYDIVIVQGGLHHLPRLPGDLEQVIAHVRRILKPQGTFYVVEPWSTPFLTMVHFIVEQGWVRRIYAKGDALAEMTDHERVTYEQWLGQPASILNAFDKEFETKVIRTRWGKLMYEGSPRRG